MKQGQWMAVISDYSVCEYMVMVPVRLIDFELAYFQ